MHYCDINFKSKKQLKEAVEARLTGKSTRAVTVFNPETISGELPTPTNGTVCVGGPHFPEPHKWYATVTIQNGEVIKVK